MCPRVLKEPKYAGSNRVKYLLCQFPSFPLSAAFQLPQAVVPQDKHGVLWFGLLEDQELLDSRYFQIKSANSPYSFVPNFRYLQPSSSLKPWCRRTNMGFYGLVFLKTRNFQFPDIFKSKVLIARIHLFQISAICSLPAPSSLGAAVLIPTVTVIAATFQSGSRSCLLTSNNFFKHDCIWIFPLWQGFN